MKATDVSQSIDQALSHVHTAWTLERHTVVVATVRRRRRARRRAWQVSAPALATLCVLGAWLSWGSVTPPTPHESASLATSADNVTTLPDGTVLTYLDEAADVTLAELTTNARHVTMKGGDVRFAVAADPVRPFVVHVRGLIVEVMGTTFVLRDLGDEVEVSVEEGLLRAIWPEGERQLRANERARFSTRASAPQTQPILRPVSEPPRHSRPSAPKWRSLAQAGRYDEAYVALRTIGVRSVPDEAAALLEAGDVARLSLHPQKAVAPISRMVAQFPKDPRAPLAAFTLGLVYMQELGRAADAARAFAHAQELEPAGLMAEDALARQVEAWFRAGDTARAHSTAEEYVRLHPQGRRLQAVRHHGGLD